MAAEVMEFDCEMKNGSSAEFSEESELEIELESGESLDSDGALESRVIQPIVAAVTGQVENELREGLEGVRREVGEGVKVLEKTERLLEGLKSKLANGHGEGEQVVNGIRPGERINGLAAGGPNEEGGGGGIVDGGGGGETGVIGNGTQGLQPPLVTFTQATERKEVVKMSGDEPPPQHLLPLPQQHQQDDDDEDDEESDDEEQEEPDKGLPHNGPLITTKPQVGQKVWVQVERNLTEPWAPGTVKEILAGRGGEDNFRVDLEEREVTVDGKKIAQGNPATAIIPVGTRVIALYREETVAESSADEGDSRDSRNSQGSDFYPAVIGEKAKTSTDNRYLVFFDDGFASYLEHADLRVVVKFSTDVWLDVDRETREFMKEYIQSFPLRRMIRLEVGAKVRVEQGGSTVEAEVTKVDGALAGVTFPDSEDTLEWIYRGSMRFEPLAKSMGVKFERGVVRKEGHRRPLPTLNCPKPRPFTPHICSSACLLVKPSRSLPPPLNPLIIPLWHGWRRLVSQHLDPVAKGNWTVFYKTPCGRRLKSMEEVHMYNRMTGCSLELDFFTFDPWVQAMEEFLPLPDHVQLADISHGEERMPISASNCHDSTYPPYINYRTVPIPQKGVSINEDKGFLTGCDCTDDCTNKGLCSCWQLTIQSTRCDQGNKLNVEAGYVNRRLPDVVLTGIYECNSACACSNTCTNRLVQFPIRSRLQIFKTENRGWGIRTLDDMPQGTFIATYVGKLYGPEEGNIQGTQFGDSYFADLDMIEVVEGRKEGYESDVEDIEAEENEEKKDEELKSEEGKMEVDDVKNEKVGEHLAEGKPGEATEAKPQAEEDSVPKKEELKPKEEEKEPKVKHKSVRKYFGPQEDIYIMDAMTEGNIGRYLNHSCDPNVFVQNVFIESHDLRFPTIAFFTFKFVPAGSELCWNYNYEVGTVENKQIICNCGAKNCKGRLL